MPLEGSSALPAVSGILIEKEKRGETPPPKTKPTARGVFLAHRGAAFPRGSPVLSPPCTLPGPSDVTPLGTGDFITPKATSSPTASQDENGAEPPSFKAQQTPGAITEHHVPSASSEGPSSPPALLQMGKLRHRFSSPVMEAPVPQRPGCLCCPLSVVIDGGPKSEGTSQCAQGGRAGAAPAWEGHPLLGPLWHPGVPSTAVQTDVL